MYMDHIDEKNTLFFYRKEVIFVNFPKNASIGQKSLI